MKVKLNSILNFCLCVVLDHFQNRDSFNCNFLIRLNLRSSVFLASFFNHSVNYKPLLPNCNNFPAARKIIVSIPSPKKERKKLSKLNFNISIKNNYYFIFYLFKQIQENFDKIPIYSNLLSWLQFNFFQNENTPFQKKDYLLMFLYDYNTDTKKIIVLLLYKINFYSIEKNHLITF